MKKSIILSLLLLITSGVFAQVQVSSNLTIIGTGRPGEAYEGVIKLQNSGEKSENVKIYQRDFLFYADGLTTYDEPGTAPRSNAAWITFSPNFVTIPSGGSVDVGYRVQVPDYEELSGSYWSLIFIEEIPGELEAQTEDGKYTLSISQIVRYGIQIITEIGGTGYAELAFVNPLLSSTDGRKTFSIDIENTGEIWFLSEFSCTIFDLLGEKLELISGNKARLYPGTSVRVVFELPDLNSGSYRALIVADGGGDNLFGGNYTLKFDE
jgi:hypothetical protein